MTEVFKPELALFDPPEVQTAIVNGAWADIYPSGSNLNTGEIEFEIVGNNDYVDLNDTVLTVNASIVTAANGAALDATDDVAFINAPLYSMFSDVKVILNGVRVDGGESNYPYKAMMSMLFSFSKSTLDQQMFSAGYIKDVAGKMDSDVQANSAHEKRSKWNAGHTFIGRLMNDTFQQPRYLLNNVTIKIVLSKATAEFAILAVKAVANPKFIINSAKLTIRRVTVSDSIMAAHEKALLRSNVIYPYPRKVINYFGLNPGIQVFIKENIYDGETPKMLIIALVQDDAFNGSFKKNPFNFIHANVCEVSVKRDGVNHVAQPYNPDFKAKEWMREYMAIYNLFGREENLSFTHDEYGAGYTFFVFNLTPDLSMTNALLPNSSLRLKVKFAEKLKETLSLITFALFDGVFEIDKNRKVYTNI
jgi:hypothetical protein